jgi:hypothetical protein
MIQASGIAEAAKTRLRSLNRMTRVASQAALGTLSTLQATAQYGPGPIVFFYVVIMLLVRGTLSTVNILLALAQVVLNSILVTNPTGLTLQWLRLARDVGEYFVGPLLGLYLLQIILVTLLAPTLRDVLRAAVTVTLIDVAKSGMLAMVDMMVQLANLLGFGGRATVMIEAVLTALPWPPASFHISSCATPCSLELWRMASH